MRRIGPKMQMVADYVANNPGCTKQAAGIHVGPHGSNRYGWLAVQRAIHAGLVYAIPRRGGGYRLYVPGRAGEALWEGMR